MKKKTEAGYHYTACGLENVYLMNLPLAHDRAGHETITIPNINLLHSVLRQEVAQKAASLNNREIRFLRSGLGLTQSELAKVLHKDGQTVGRWERGETLIDGASETLLRAMVLEELPPKVPVGIKDLAILSQTGAQTASYRIEASDPAHYRPAA